jgi:hypothetical protein
VSASEQAEPFNAFVRRVAPEYAILILFEFDQLRETLARIAAGHAHPSRLAGEALDRLASDEDGGQ